MRMEKSTRIGSKRVKFVHTVCLIIAVYFLFQFVLAIGIQKFNIVSFYHIVSHNVTRHDIPTNSAIRYFLES